MDNQQVPRREFLKMLAGAFSVVAVDWDAFPKGFGQVTGAYDYDAILIG